MNPEAVDKFDTTVPVRPSEGGTSAPPDVSRSDVFDDVPRPPLGEAEPPPRINGYRIIGHLGRGGMGSVWQAVQLSTHREVALKVMGDMSWLSPRARLRFDREVEIASRLEHPHIARIYDSGLQQGLYYYAMELIKGRCLDDYVRENQLDEGRLLRLFILVCKAVQHAHQRGVIHRDLKPSNILVSEDGQPHLVDFGLAKDMIAQAGPIDQNVSIAGDIAGTPFYMSPEQANGQTDLLDTRTDVYSLGIVLYRLRLNRFPRGTDGSYLEVLRRIQSQDPLAPKSVDRTIHADLAAVILKAMAREPDQRYFAAGELARDLEQFVEGKPVAACAPTLGYILRRQFWRYRFALCIAAGVAGLLLTAGVISYIRIKIERDIAVGARRIADIARRDADVQRQTALAARRDAEVQLAENRITGGNELGMADRWVGAKLQYQQAAEVLRRAGAPTAPADLGLWMAEMISPSCVNDFPLSGGVLDAATLPDGRHVLTGGADGRLRLVDCATGTEELFVQAHRDSITAVAVSTDGSRAASASRDGTTIFWDLSARAPLRVMSCPGGWVTGVTLSHDGRRLLAISGETAQTLSRRRNDLLTLWNVDDGSPQQTFTADGRVTAARFAADGMRLLTAGASLQLWELGQKNRVELLKTLIPQSQGASVTAMAFAPDLLRAAVSFRNGQLMVLDLLSSAQTPFSIEGGPRVCQLAFTEDGRFLISAADDWSVCRWDIATARRQKLWMAAGSDPGETSAPPRGGIISADRSLTALFSEKRLVMFNLREESGSITLQGGGGLGPGAALLAGGRVAIAGGPELPVLWDVESGLQLRPSWLDKLGLGGEGNSRKLAFSADGRTAVLVRGPRAYVVDLYGGRLVNSFEIDAPGGAPVEATLLQNGDVLATGGPAGTVSIWDVNSGRRTGELPGRGSTVTSLAASVHGEGLAVGSRDGVAEVWNWKTRSARIRFVGDSDGINALAFSPNGGRIATGAGNAFMDTHDDYSVRLWDAGSGSLITRLIGHTAPVRGVAFCPVESWLISISDDRTARFWSSVDGAFLRTVSLSSAPTGVSVSDDGRRILIESSEGLMVWDLWRPRDLQERLSRAAGEKDHGAGPLSSHSALGRWYAFRGLDAWAIDQFAAGLDDQTNLLAARCYWRLGKLDVAERIVDAAAPSASDENERFAIQLIAQTLRSTRVH